MSLRPLSSEEMQALEAAPSKDPLTSALRGFDKAMRGTVNTYRHPIETVSALTQALRSPKETAKTVWSGLKSDWAEDPVSTLVENFMPSPLPSGGKLKHIVLPERMATKAEKVAAREARRWLNSELRKPFTKRDMMNTFYYSDLMDESAKQFDGWYLNNDGTMIKDFGVPEIDVKALIDLKPDSGVELKRILKDPDLLSRFEDAAGVQGRPHLTILKEEGTRQGRPGGGSYDASSNDIWVRDDDISSQSGTFHHELQHAAQEYGGMKYPFTGTSPDYENSFIHYMINPGEVQARVADHRRMLSPKLLGEISSAKMEDTIKDMWMDPGLSPRNRVETLAEVLRHYQRLRGTDPGPGRVATQIGNEIIYDTPHDPYGVSSLEAMVKGLRK